jgi:peptide-methionine (S)-S-oxide reductase
VLYDPKKVYEKLLDVFWHNIDPTVVDRQSRRRYSIEPIRLRRRARAAEASKAAIEKAKPFKEAIVTPIVAATVFWPAEEYHQDYYRKNPVRYTYYRTGCGRDARLKQLWGAAAPH